MRDACKVDAEDVSQSDQADQYISQLLANQGRDQRSVHWRPLWIMASDEPAHRAIVVRVNIDDPGEYDKDRWTI